MSVKSCVVYAFPHAGATASIYQKWSRNLQQHHLDVELVGIELPGRGRLAKQEAILNLSDLIEYLASFIRTDFAVRQKNGAVSWMAFGHSFGGVLGYTVVSYLYHYFQLIPKTLVISGSVAPTVQSDDKRAAWSDEQIFRNIQKLGGTPSLLLNNETIKKQLIHQFRHDYIIRDQFKTFKHDAIYLKAHLIHARQDSFIDEQKLFAWQQHFSEQLDVTYIDGGHFSIYENFDVIKNIIKAYEK